jgi:ferredoxin
MDGTGEKPRVVALCSCQGTMTLDPAAVARGCGAARVETGVEFCGAESERFRRIASEAGGLLVGCTQERPALEAALEGLPNPSAAAWAELRTTGGWGADGPAAGPKMAALLAAAAEAAEPPKAVTLESDGVLLILGADQAALDAAEKLKDRLDVTVLLARAEGVAPPRLDDYPVRLGRVRSAKGHLGAFELTVDGFAAPLPSSRAAYAFGPKRDGAVSTCDVVLDLTGGAPLFPAHALRPGYLKADPRDRAAVMEAVFQAADMVGSFDKPRYVELEPALCAHSRSRKTGCTRCLELCPTGAISSAGDHVAIDAAVCAGCGQCAAACPTGAIEYALPRAEALVARLRAALLAFREAGGRDPIVLLHDEVHGAALVDAAGRFGPGLPAKVVPLAVNEVTQVGLEAVAAAFAHGAAGVRFLLKAKPAHDPLGLMRTATLANTVIAALGYGAGLVSTIETDDPDALVEALRAGPPGVAAAEPSRFRARGAKRGVLGFAMQELRRVAPAPVEVVPLPRGAPFGTLNIDVQGCTLCLSCVSACPTKALSDDPDKPTLRFKEDACVQCGLCAATCPEKVIALEPRVNFAAFNAPPVTVKQEEPFPCIACGTPFGTRSTIERVAAKLEGRHWMFAGLQSKRADVIKMCDKCRVEAVTNEGFDPYGAPQRPAPRTTDDYLRERETAGRDPLG